MRLDTTLDTRTSKPGDTFTATVSQPVIGSDGQVLIPTGSVVDGTVAQVQKGGKLGGKSVLQLRFEQLRLPDGHTAGLQASLSGVNTKQSGTTGAIASTTEGTASTNNEGGVQQSNTRRTVGDVVAGTAAGALLGAIAGGGHGAKVGGALGAAAGLGVVLATNRNHLQLKQGTPLTITLNQPLTVQ